MKRFVLCTIAALFVGSVALAGDSTAVKMKVDSMSTKARPDSTAMKSQTKKEPVYKMTKSGVKYQDLVVGTGKECQMGSKVECHYTLWFADSTGKKLKRFQSSKDGPGRPFQCTLGYRLIKGWSDGMVGMKEGGTRELVISPELGYGKGGGPIPPNQWLVFEIDFLHLLN